MNTGETNMLLGQLQYQIGSLSTQSTPVDAEVVLAVRESINEVAHQISEINFSVSNRLAALKTPLFTETIQQIGVVSYRQFFPNPTVCGQVLEALEYAKSIINQPKCGSLCHLLHPDIEKVSGKLYRDGSYAEAACNAFIEINSRLKGIYHENKPTDENVPDGQSLMNRIFADSNPMLEAGDLTTQTGKDIQSGTRFMFAGAMSALRNPKSHQNITLKKDDCMRRLIFASMLMYQIDEIIANSGRK